MRKSELTREKQRLLWEEIQNAKREEIRGSLEDLVTYMEEHKDKEDDDNA